MMEFKTSSFCSLGDCVEVANTEDGGAVFRDTKTGDTLVLDKRKLTEFIAGVNAGEFDVKEKAA